MERLVRPAWAWDGTARDFLQRDTSAWRAALEEHHNDLLGDQPSAAQRTAWDDSARMLEAALALCTQQMNGVEVWGVVFEYELPLEGGRRPDVVVLAGATVVVIEFKTAPLFSTANFDQVAAYARDIHDYHSESRDAELAAVLASTSGKSQARTEPGVLTAGTPEQLADALTGAAAGSQRDRTEWLQATYAPLPTIVEAARVIFRHEPLPRIKRHESLGVDDSVTAVHELAAAARSDDSLALVLIAGVPGAGKTLAGLRTVYEYSGDEALATFLSGNGPLVQVLQDALGSSVFVRDLHAAVKSFGLRGQTPRQRLIVFDEAQRAWDAAKMFDKHGLRKSEPEVLIEAAERIPGWAVLVGLVGEGQEIHGGEEGGLGQWADAIHAGGRDWHIVVPPRLATVFDGLDVATDERLDLSVSLRSHRAEHLHDWVSRLLGEELERAGARAVEIERDDFPIRLFRDLEAAKAYTRERYEQEEGKLYGLLASSHAKNLPKLGVDNSWRATSQVRIARWFNDPPHSPQSARNLDQPATEFMCQGLELDLPVVCWGSDLLWGRDGWSVTPIRRKFPLQDPEQIVLNTYRVLLTRGRDGLVLFVPPGPAYDPTADALVAAGAQSE